ncbi:saccharopine dehydrogenase (nadp+ l-glutamate-forming) [Moniliophthora roreri MCA 2997]|uniref:Saccharopine dehydrogenase (Nadp+ l-glutamate-forming) n=2 Tax=Moniliophthora roreri TaxID=221103 RepID=V2WQS2_MONRO|nr:saccharopine dehydrogenase (nadp+ l-glutamate-forming) [Moniliophthora roreri MCA 2997]
MKFTLPRLRPLTIGIRREDPTRIWERRAPLTPDSVYELVKDKGVEVHVEGCERRIFKDEEYIKAGATIRPNLNDAHIVMGIKEPPLDRLLLDPLPLSNNTTSKHERTYMMFSHTVKGQAYNMPLLSAFLSNHPSHVTHSDLLPTLIDYELLTNEIDGKRTVGFGWYAGVAGVLESLSSMAHSHLEHGVASPFLYTPRPHTLPSLDALRASLHSIGDRIAAEGTPKALGPFVIGLTGTGNVAEGCLSILSELPIERVRVEDLHALVTNPDTSLKKIYLVHAKPKDYFTRKGFSAGYSREDYYAHPGEYVSVFAERIAPYLTLFLNGTGWAPGYPRLMTDGQLVEALVKAKDLPGGHTFRATNVGDISCDPEGGLQYLTHASTLSDPFYKIRPRHDLPEVTMMAVDILPTSIPLDASKGFDEGVKKYLGGVIRRYHGKKDEADEIERALQRATIAKGGELVEKHQWLWAGVDKWRKEILSSSSRSSSASNETQPRSSGSKAQTPRKIVMLGSGMVAGPAVEVIRQRALSEGNLQLVVVTNDASQVELMRYQLKQDSTDDSVVYEIVDMSDISAVSRLVDDAQVDVVISLLPVPFHPSIAELCIKHKKHLVTASYISPQMKSLHERALSANVLLLNEIGLDPGIDHCSAIDLIESQQVKGKKVVSFISFCGGLPSPDVTEMGPLKYKFSWSPRGVLTAALNGARAKLRGKEFEVPGEQLLKSYFDQVPIRSERFKTSLEGLPNRDSFPYADTYGLGPVKDLRTILRGTLRYQGFSTLLHFFNTLGLLELNATIKDLHSWTDLVSQAQKLRRELHADAEQVDLSSLKGGNEMEALTWMLSEATGSGALSSSSDSGNISNLLPRGGLPPVPKQPTTPLDLFTLLLSHKLRYAPDERDVVVMSHEVITTVPGQVGKEEIHTSELVAYGDEMYSAMARTVGTPVGLAALAVLDGRVEKVVRGVAGPGHQSVRHVVLRGLEEVGLGMKEGSRTVDVESSGSMERALKFPL